MYVLVTYDVSTSTPEGKRRLRQVARACMDRGQRVQHSVFECKVDPGQLAELKHRLTGLIDPTTDSLRFYSLGRGVRERVEHVGAKPSLDIDGPLIA